jgi:superfamily II DNA/RNA helicase
VESKPQVIIFFNSIPEQLKFYTLLKNEKNKFVINNQRASDTGKNNININYIHGRCTAICNPRFEHFHPEDCGASKTARVTMLRNKEIQVLLGTETIGRGIDIRTVTLVINYSEPMKSQS